MSDYRPVAAKKGAIATYRPFVGFPGFWAAAIMFGIPIRRKDDEEDAGNKRLPGCGGSIAVLVGDGGPRPRAYPTRPRRADVTVLMIAGLGSGSLLGG